MAVQLTEVQYELLRKIAEDNDLVDYVLEEYLGSEKGDNYLGYVLSVALTSKTKQLELIVKVCPQNENFRNSVPIRDIFLKEMHMYENVLAMFATYQKQSGVTYPFESIAKCYGVCKRELDECLILENLVKNGYSLWNRKLPMTAGHIALVMKEFGKYHAVSLAMKNKNTKQFENVSTFLNKPPTEYDNKSLQIFLRDSCETIQNAIQGNSVLENAYKNLTSQVQIFFMEELMKNEDKMVIIHGDAWCNNMLFKYADPSDKTKPTNVCFIDWQLSRYALPVLDLAHFFCVSASKEILDDYKKYLKIYYSSLSHNLKEMSCDPQEIFSIEDLKYLWKKYAKYGLILGGFVFKILLVESKDAAHTQQNTSSIDDFFKQFVVTGHEELLNQKIVDLFNFMLDNDFI